MKNSLKILSIGTLAALSVGCAYSPNITKSESYHVSVDVYETKTPYNTLLSQTTRAVVDHGGDKVGDVYRLPTNKEDTLYHYGIHERILWEACTCFKISMDESYDSNFYNTVHLETVAEKDEEVSFNSVKIRPYNDYYVKDNRDYVYSNADFSIEVSKLRENRALLDFHYVEEKLVSLDDVSTESVFVPLDDHQFEVNYDRMSSPMSKDGVTMVKLEEQEGGSTKIFMMSVSPK
jgi:hypothetical protein